MDQKSILRTLTINKGAILTPYIELYQGARNFPKEWVVTIPNTKEKDGHFHPSSDAFLPPRDLYLKIKGISSSPPPSPALQRTFDCGHMWHGYLEAILMDMDFVNPGNVERKVTQTKIGPYGEFTGSGTGDLVNVKVPGHGDWLVDIKTMNKNEFEAGPNKFTFMKWEAQVSCYMDWFGADQALILAICKDSPHQMREFQIIKNESLLSEIYDRWSYTAKCVRDNVLPEDNYEPIDPTLLNPGDSVLDLILSEKVPTIT